MRGVAGGCGQREERHAGGDHGRGEDLAAADVLVELVHPDDEQEDDRRPEHRLDERERRLRERVRLPDPADDSERRSGDPARPAEEPVEERNAQRALGRLLARLDGLQPHPEREHRRGAERGQDSDQESGHDVPRP